MRKFQKYFLELARLNYKLKIYKNAVKEEIGDSINNNRTLSVNQVLRYLNGHKTAKNITTVYSVLKPYIKNDRKVSTKRTDAIDMGELVATYRAVVMDDKKLRKTLGRKLV